MFARATCPACQYKFSIPEGDMGKRHTCPNCQSPFTAGKTPGEPEAPAVSMKAQAPPDAAYNKTMLGDSGPPITFNCPRCKKALEAPAIEAGTKKPCPNCGQRLQVPAASPAAAPQAAAGLNKTILASDEGKAEPIRYNCPNCKKPLESPASEALTKKNCPSCGQRLQIPAASTGGRPNLNKTVLASDESKGQTSGNQAGPPASAPAAAAAPGAAPAAQTTPGSLTMSKNTLLIGGGLVAIGLMFLLLLACVVSIFIGSSERKAAADLAALQAKLEKERDVAERKAEQEKRDFEMKMLQLNLQAQAAAGLKGRARADAEEQLEKDREAANRRREEHERELARIRAEGAAAAAAAAAARPPWYRGGYWYNGHWYPY